MTTEDYERALLAVRDEIKKWRQPKKMSNADYASAVNAFVERLWAIVIPALVKFDNGAVSFEAQQKHDEPREVIEVAQSVRADDRAVNLDFAKPVKRVVLFDVSGSVMGNKRVFDIAWRALIETYQQHSSDDIKVVAFSERTERIFNLSDLVFGRVRIAGGGTNLRRALTKIGEPDALTIISDEYQEWPETWLCPTELRLIPALLDDVSPRIPSSLINSLAQKGGSICLAS